MNFLAKTLTKAFKPSSHRPYGATSEEAHENTKPISPPGTAREVLSTLRSRGKAGALARPAEQIHLTRRSSQDSFASLESKMGDGNIAVSFPPSTSPTDDAARTGGNAYIDEQLAQEIDALDRQGLLRSGQRAAVGRLSKEHQAYLCSDEGLAALRQAGKGGRRIDFQKFAKIPTQLLTPHPQFPSPLFRLATGEVAKELGEAEYNNALTNATQCNIFDVKQTASDGRNPIHIAALHGNAPAIEALVDLDKQTAKHSNKMALNAANGDHQSPLEIAVDSRAAKAAQVAEILIAGGANLVPKRTKHGVLQQAVRSGDPALVEVLAKASHGNGIRYGKDKRGETPLAALRALSRGVGRTTNLPKEETMKIHGILEAYKAAAKQPQDSWETIAPTREWKAIGLDR